MANLSTSPQLIGSNTSSTIRTYLYAWYTNQSGNSCTVHARLNVISAGVTYTGTSKLYALNIGGSSTGTVSWSYAPLNSNQEYTVDERTWTYSGGDTISASALWWSYVYGSADITSLNNTWKVPVFTTPPTGLSVSDITKSTNSFTANVSITGWGQGGTTAGRYRELQVWTYTASGLSTPRRYQPQYGSELSGYITVDNNSLDTDGLIITPNTSYVIGAFATNGASNTSSQRVGAATTLAEAPTLSVTTIGDESVEISYSTTADGGAYEKSIQYSLDGGNTWETAVTIASGAETTGTFTIDGLDSGTTYTLKNRVSTSAGETNGQDIEFTTEAGKIYCKVDGETKRIKKIYVNVNGSTKEVQRAYVKVNGVTKKAF